MCVRIKSFRTHHPKTHTAAHAHRGQLRAGAPPRTLGLPAPGAAGEKTHSGQTLPPRNGAFISDAAACVGLLVARATCRYHGWGFGSCSRLVRQRRSGSALRARACVRVARPATRRLAPCDLSQRC